MLKNGCGCKISHCGFGGEKMEYVPLCGALSSLDCSPIYFSENDDSCYWFDSRGLSLYISGINEISGIRCQICFQSMMETLFKSIYFNETVNIARFSDNLLSGIKEAMDHECDCNDGITIFIPWRSIALIILSGRGPGIDGIDVMIGNHDYSILC